MQVESFGQQKSEGKLPPHCCRPSTPPHVCACRRKRLDACVDVITDAKKKKAEILDILAMAKMCKAVQLVRDGD
jgi:hypothetical protein